MIYPNQLWFYPGFPDLSALYVASNGKTMHRCLDIGLIISDDTLIIKIKSAHLRNEYNRAKLKG